MKGPGLGGFFLLILLGAIILSGNDEEEPQPAEAAEPPPLSLAEVPDGEKIDYCLEHWGDSNPSMIARVMQHLREPDSFEPVGAKVVPMGDDEHHAYALKYRARNGFGGMTVEVATAAIRNTDCRVSDLKFGQ